MSCVRKHQVMFLCLTFLPLSSSSVTSFCHSVDVSSQHSSSRVHVTSWSLISVVGRQGRPQTLQSSCCERCWQVDSSWMLPADPPWCSGEVRCWRGRWLSVCWGPLPASREYLFFCTVKTSENEVSQRQQHYLYSECVWLETIKETIYVNQESLDCVTVYINIQKPLPEQIKKDSLTLWICS